VSAEQQVRDAYHLDTLAVRKILDANGLVSTPAMAVITERDLTLGRIIKLDMASRNLTTITADIGVLTAATYIRLDSNQLTTLPPQIGSCVACQYLLASNNNISSLPNELGSMTGLVRLSLIGNQIQVLPASIGSLPNLQSLIVTSNLISSIPDELAALGAMTAFSFDYNRVCTLTAAITTWLSSGVVQNAVGIDWSNPPDWQMATGQTCQ